MNGVRPAVVGASLGGMAALLGNGSVSNGEQAFSAAEFLRHKTTGVENRS